MEKMKIKISEVIALHERFEELNKPSLNEVEFIDDDGNPVEIDKKLIEQFQYSGLCNTDFIYTGFYKRGWETVEKSKDL